MTVDGLEDDMDLFWKIIDVRVRKVNEISWFS